MLTSIDVKFIFSSIVHVYLGCSAPQIFSNSLCRPSSCLLAVLAMFFRLVLTLQKSEMSAIFVFTTKTTHPRPQVFAVNGA